MGKCRRSMRQHAWPSASEAAAAAAAVVHCAPSTCTIREEGTHPQLLQQEGERLNVRRDDVAEKPEKPCPEEYSKPNSCDKNGVHSAGYGSAGDVLESARQSSIDRGGASIEFRAGKQFAPHNRFLFPVVFELVSSFKFQVVWVKSGSHVKKHSKLAVETMKVTICAPQTQKWFNTFSQTQS